MTTVKEILSENRESIISSIKYAFKIWKHEDVKAKMIELLAYAEVNLSVGKFETCRAKKTMLKALVERMKRSTEKSLEDLIADANEREELAGNCFNQITSTWEKKSYKNQIFH